MTGKTNEMTEQLCNDIERYVYRMLPYSKLEHKVKDGIITITLSMLFLGSLRSSSLTIHQMYLPNVLDDSFPHARTWATTLVQQTFDFGPKLDTAGMGTLQISRTKGSLVEPASQERKGAV